MSNLTDFSKTRKSAWLWAFIGTAVALIGVTVALLIVALSGPDAPPPTPELPDGAETGVYYYDVEDGEIVLTLNSGNAFAIAGPSLNKSGTYTVDGTTITLDFVRNDDGEATATINGDTIVLNYLGKVMTFLKKINYTVTFNTAGGSAIEPVQILNGKAVTKPSDPKKENSLFIGWYADEACTTPYDFASAITANVTVYAAWEAKIVGQDEFIVNFELGYEGATAPEAVSTFNAKIPADRFTTPTREGYTFGGWYVSMYDDATKLSYEVTADTVLTGDTTLYAVWHDDSKTNLKTPGVSVTATGLKWSAVSGVSNYSIKITDQNGEVVLEKTTGATTETFSFDALAPGDYKVEVTAVANNTANNSDTAVRYYRNKTLDMVSGFRVLNGILVYNPVAKAEQYILNVSCGNPAHNHVNVNNGDSNVFNFNNCTMQPGGIKFTVVATAVGYADSVPAVYVYEKSLAAVDGLTYDESRDSFVWNNVENAVSYKVTVTVGDVTTNLSVSKPIFSLAEYTGDVKITVTPIAEGYNSPAAQEATYTKTAPKAPTGIAISGTVVSWDDLGVDSYVIKVGSSTFTSSTNTYDLYGKDLGLSVGDIAEVTVTAIKDGKTSSASAPVSICSRDMSSTITYKANTVTWPFVFGFSNYEVVVNDGEPVKVEGKNSLKITLSKAGDNVIKVRCTDLGENSVWSTIVVTAYEVTYFSRTVTPLTGEVTKYYAFGDVLDNPVFVNDGYTFAGWYNSPGVAAGNAKEITETVYNQYGDSAFFANWKPNEYTVNFNLGTDAAIDGGATSATVTYNQKFTLPVPVSVSDPDGKFFIGWYADPTFSDGSKITDETGASLANYKTLGDTTLYPQFAAALIFDDLGNGTVEVRKGEGIVNRNVTSIKIPAEHQGKPVVSIKDYGFTNCRNLVKVEMPDTITRIGQGAFDQSINIAEFVVYKTTDANAEAAVYSSEDGAILYYDETSQQTYLEIFPLAKTGTYKVSEKVQSIRTGAFKNCSIEKVIISKNVLNVAENAFENCNRLTTIEFEFGRDKYVTIFNQSISEGTNSTYVSAFKNLPNVTSIKLPAKMNELENVKSVFDAFESLSAIIIEEGNEHYKSVENFLCDASGFTLLYVPIKYAGDNGVFKMPVPIREITTGVFEGNTALKEVVIPSHVVSIGDYAFRNCTGLVKFTVEGPRAHDLSVGESAFAGCRSIKSITFDGTAASGATGKIILGNFAFANCSSTSEINIGANVVISSMGEGVFEGNSKLVAFNVDATATVKAIPANAFKNCASLPTFIVPKDVTRIENGAFEGCTNLNSFGFADNIGSVAFGTDTFKGCISLKTIILPATVSGFDGSNFAGCEAIDTIIVDPANPNLMDYDGALYAKNGSEIELVYFPRNKVVDLAKLNPETTKIGASVFKNNLKVTEVVIIPSVNSIGASAFEGCTNLTSVVFDDSSAGLTIGAKAFADCTALTSVTVTTTTKNSGTANALPANTTIIGSGAFLNVPLASITLPENCKAIGVGAFANTNIASLVIPASVEYIGSGAFYGINELTTLTFAPTANMNALELGVSNSYNPAYNLQKVDIANLGGLFEGTSLTSVDLPARVVNIGNKAFYGIESLTSVTIPAEAVNLGIIEGWAFANTGITEITLPNGLKKILACAFAGSKLAAIEIPGSVDYIEGYAFNTSTIKAITFGTEQPVGDEGLTLRPYAFIGTDISTITLPADVISIGEFDSLVDRYVVENVFFYPQGAQITNPITGKLETPEECNVNLAKIYVDEANPYYASKDGVLYGKGKYTDKYAVLLLSPRANDGTEGVVTVPKETVMVQNSAFVSTKYITKIIFEEFEEGEAGYGNKTLKIGTFAAARGNLHLAPPVIGTESQLPEHVVSALTEIRFPAHLGVLNTHAIRGIQAADRQQATLTVYFSTNPHPDDKGVELEQFAIAQAPILKAVQNLRLSKVGDMSIGSCNNMTTLDLRADSTVTKIEVRSFYQSGSLTSITIPASVTSIEESAFENASMLSEIVFSTEKNLTYIAPNAFKGCASLREVNLPEGIQTIADKAFSGCTLTRVYIPTTLISLNWRTNTKIVEFDISPDHLQLVKEGDKIYYLPVPGDMTNKQLAYEPPAAGEFVLTPENSTVTQKNNQDITSVYVAEGTKQIPASMFENCSNITTVFIPYTVTHIYEGAFKYCSNIVEVIIEDNPEEGRASRLEYIGGSAFLSCSKIVTVHIPDTVTGINNAAFQGCTSYVGESVEEGLILPPALTAISQNCFRSTAIAKVTIQGNNITALYAYAFYDCKNVTAINLPNTLQTIGQYALGKTAIAELVLPASVNKIDDCAFADCTQLKKIDLSQTAITSLRIQAVYADERKSQTMFSSINNRVYIEEIILPAGVTNIPANYFISFDHLKKVTLPANLSSIGDMAFMGQTGLQEIAFPEMISTIGSKAFYGCTSLSKVTFASENSPLARISVETFKNTAIIAINLPNNVKAIDASAFENSKLVTADFTGVEEIGAGAFRNCPIVSINIPASVDVIGDNAFAGCSAATSITIADGVTEMGYSAFSDNTNVTSVAIPSTVTVLRGNPYVNFPNAILTNNSAMFKYENGVLTNPTGNMFYYYAPQNTAQTIKFPEDQGTVYIKPGAFSGSKLVTVNFNEQITEIPDSAFKGSTLLTSVSFTTKITAIGSYAFEGCTSLNNVSVPASVTSIGDYAFANCTTLSSIVINAAADLTVGDGLFSGCSAITSVVPGIGYSNYMYENTGVTEATVTYDDSVKEYYEDGIAVKKFLIYEGIFANCQNLTTVTIDIGGQISDRIHLGANLFRNCSNLTTVNVVNGVLNHIADGVFAGTAIESLNLGEKNNTLFLEGEDLFSGVKKLYIHTTYLHLVGNVFSGLTADTTIRFVNFKNESKLREAFGDEAVDKIMNSGATVVFGKEAQGEEEPAVTLTEDEMKMVSALIEAFKINPDKYSATLQDALLNYKTNYSSIVYPSTKEFFEPKNAESLLNLLKECAPDNMDAFGALEKALQSHEGCAENEYMNNWYKYACSLTDELRKENFTESQLNWLSEKTKEFGEDAMNAYLVAWYEYMTNFNEESPIGPPTSKEAGEFTSWVTKELGIDNEKFVVEVLNGWEAYRAGLYEELTGNVAPSLTKEEIESLYLFITRTAGIMDAGTWEEGGKNDFICAMLQFKKDYNSPVPMSEKEFIGQYSGVISGFVKENGGDPSSLDFDALASDWYKWVCELSNEIMKNAFTEEELKWLDSNMEAFGKEGYAVVAQTLYDYKRSFSKDTPVGDVSDSELKELKEFFFNNVNPDIDEKFLDSLAKISTHYSNSFAEELGLVQAPSVELTEEEIKMANSLMELAKINPDEYSETVYEDFLNFKIAVLDGEYSFPAAVEKFIEEREFTTMLEDYLSGMDVDCGRLMEDGMFNEFMTNWYNWATKLIARQGLSEEEIKMANSLMELAKIDPDEYSETVYEDFLNFKIAVLDGEYSFPAAVEKFIEEREFTTMLEDYLAAMDVDCGRLMEDGMFNEFMTNWYNWAVALTA